METKTDKVAEQPAGAIMTSPAPTPPRRLHLAVIRLAAVALLFAGWLGYLVYLVVTLPHTGTGAPLILSHSQFLVSEVDVIARVGSDEPSTEVIVEEVLNPKENSAVKTGDKLRVSNLKQCKALSIPGENTENGPSDWTGPGSYLLPLQHIEGDIYKVAPTPPSPGYPPSGSGAGPPRIYPGNEAAKAQYRDIKQR